MIHVRAVRARELANDLGEPLARIYLAFNRRQKNVEQKIGMVRALRGAVGGISSSGSAGGRGEG
jgi:hypothetical protein